MMDKGNYDNKRKGEKVDNKLTFDPSYVFNEVYNSVSLVEFNPYNIQEEDFCEGEMITLETIDGDFYRGIIIGKVKKNKMTIELLTEIKKED